MENSLEQEITKPVSLSLSDGSLNPKAVGWSRHPLHLCSISRNYLRKKRWHYWCVTNDDYVFSATIADLDYAGLVIVYFINLHTGEKEQSARVIPFAQGMNMSDGVNEDITYESKRFGVSFKQLENAVSIDVFVKTLIGKDIEASFIVTRPPEHETLNVVVPWSSNKYQYTSKQNTLPAKGKVTYGNDRFEFPEANSFACLDYGHGVWPYDSEWNWGSASGYQGGHLIGLNLGGKWTVGTGSTENGFCIDGRLFKISEELEWLYNRKQFKNIPWRIKSVNSDAVDLTFVPRFENRSIINLVIITSHVHQLFGHYEGIIKAGGKTYIIDKLVGWAEEHLAHW